MSNDCTCSSEWNDRRCTCSRTWQERNPDTHATYCVRSMTHAPYCASRLPRTSVPMSTRAVEVFRQIESAQKVIDEVRAGLLEALARAYSDSDGGWKRSSLGEVRGATTILDDEGNPCEVHDHAVGERVVNVLAPQHGPVKGDAVAERAQQLLVEVHRVSDAALRARAAVHFLRALAPEQARLLADNITGKVASCKNCGMPVAGTRDDRLRAGQCYPCFIYWDRHGRTQYRPKAEWEKAS